MHWLAMTLLSQLELAVLRCTLELPEKGGGPGEGRTPSGQDPGSRASHSERLQDDPVEDDGGSKYVNKSDSSKSGDSSPSPLELAVLRCTLERGRTLAEPPPTTLSSTNPPRRVTIRPLPVDRKLLPVCKRRQRAAESRVHRPSEVSVDIPDVNGHFSTTSGRMTSSISGPNVISQGVSFGIRGLPQRFRPPGGSLYSSSSRPANVENAEVHFGKVRDFPDFAECHCDHFPSSYVIDSSSRDFLVVGLLSDSRSADCRRI